MKLFTACLGLALLAPVALAASPAEEAAADHLGRVIHAAIVQRLSRSRDRGNSTRTTGRHRL